MTHAVSEVSSCPWREHEIAFVWAVDYSLIRDTRRHFKSSITFLEELLKPLKGGLKAHLDGAGWDCVLIMGRTMDRRAENVVVAGRQCLVWLSLLSIAVGDDEKYKGSATEHLNACPFCQRDLRQIKGKLPFYAEFNALSSPE